MKTLLIIILLSICYHFCLAQNLKLANIEYPINISAADYLGNEFIIHADSLMPIGKDKVFKYVNTHTNKQVIDEQFEEAYPFSQGYGLVKSNGKYGIIDRGGNYIIKPKFRMFNFFSNSTDKGVTWEDGTFFDFNTGSLKKERGVYFYDYVVHNYISSYENNGKYGLIYDNGTKSKPIYDSVLVSGENVAIVKKGKKIGVVNSKGIVVMPFVFTDRVLESNRIYALKRNKEWHYFKFEKELFKNVYKPIYLKDNLFLIETTEGFNYLDNKGKVVLSNGYKWLSGSGRLGVNSNDEMVIFDNNWREYKYYTP